VQQSRISRTRNGKKFKGILKTRMGKLYGVREFCEVFIFEERLITPHFRGDLLLENVYPQIHL